MATSQITGGYVNPNPSQHDSGTNCHVAGEEDQTDPRPRAEGHGHVPVAAIKALPGISIPSMGR